MGRGRLPSAGAAQPCIDIRLSRPDQNHMAPEYQAQGVAEFFIVGLGGRHKQVITHHAQWQYPMGQCHIGRQQIAQVCVDLEIKRVNFAQAGSHRQRTIEFLSRDQPSGHQLATAVPQQRGIEGLQGVEHASIKHAQLLKRLA